MRAISEKQLRIAVDRAGLPEDAFHRILVALDEAPQTASSFETAHISYYLGALLIIGAMGWFVTSSWDRLSGIDLFGIAVAYAALFGGLGIRLFRQLATRIPGGILVAVAVCMTPLAIYGIERQLGWWPVGGPLAYASFHPRIDGNWVLMELATLALAALALRWVRFPFITAPAAYALWYLSMDVTALLFGRHWTFHQECWISVGFGLLMLLAAYLLDGDTELDFSFWFYLFGLLTFSGGLTLLGDGSQFGKAIYCLLHLLLMLLAVVLQRKAFLVFGAIGVFVYLMDEAQGYFRNSFGFTLSLTVIGALFIAAGILYKRNERSITTKLRPLTPTRIRQRHGTSAA
jgi:hypothetical protein